LRYKKKHSITLAKVLPYTVVTGALSYGILPLAAYGASTQKTLKATHISAALLKK